MKEKSKATRYCYDPTAANKMNRLFAVLSAVLLIGAFSAVTAGAAKPASSKKFLTENVVKGNTAFAVRLYRELDAGKGNLFFSPYSVSSALGMTYAGARGNTAKEMKDALHFNLEQAELPAAFKNLNRELTATAGKTGQKLNIANALVLTGGDVSSTYKGILKDYYDAEVFRGGLNGINGWVKRKTEGKIERILEELNPNSVCVILNAIYFKGNWENQFDKSSTRDAPFIMASGKRVRVPLMHRKGEYKFVSENDFQAASIPYKGNDLSMVVLLPNTANGLPAVEKRLNIQNLKEWLSKLDGQSVQEIDLYLPNFKLETGYDLVSPFKRMGIKDAFKDKVADFRGMGARVGEIHISQIKHKAYVEVNEEGTEAAAATAVEMATKAVLYNPVFRADHPFFFIIRDNRTGAILFMGRLVDPAGK